MSTAWTSRYALRTKNVKSSAIRELLKITQHPEVISFAGGLPAPDVFPIERFSEACSRVLEQNGKVALQYGATEGYEPLREMIARHTSRYGIKAKTEHVLITSGSQQALDLIGKIFLDPGDAILCEKPTYLGALQAFNQYQPRYVVVPMDDDGMRVDEVERLLDRDRSSHRIKFIYALPNFQNPTGRTMSLERRHRLVELADQYGVPIVEDDPYGELRYEGEPLPALKALDPNGETVIYLGTFSKILAPGFRLGWIVASHDALEVLLHGKQPTDLHTGMAQQMATYFVSRDGFVDEHVEHIKNVYRERRDVMLRAIEEHFPEDAHFTRPAGGLFVWAELPPNIDTRELLLAAVKERVAFVPGQGFHPDGSGTNTMRLNFSNVPPDQLREGIRRLGQAIQTRLQQATRSEPPVTI
jgi:DNA-binding transcriptional MocR family regulator